METKTWARRGLTNHRYTVSSTSLRRWKTKGVEEAVIDQWKSKLAARREKRDAKRPAAAKLQQAEKKLQQARKMATAKAADVEASIEGIREAQASHAKACEELREAQALVAEREAERSAIAATLAERAGPEQLDPRKIAEQLRVRLVVRDGDRQLVVDGICERVVYGLVVAHVDGVVVVEQRISSPADPGAVTDAASAFRVVQDHVTSVFRHEDLASALAATELTEADLVE
jgi:hypothetical protein